MGDIHDAGRNIRATRKDAGLAQQELADLAGTSQRTVRSIENGTGNPSLASVVAVAQVLGLRVLVQ
ncbi:MULTISPECIES: helix-turn-helix transcriptional regulator [Kocuria]|uniref:Helix-turn-helix transcriptional regulator n=1 Tax=Kocuria subflava TaxID=1736139 RepID=A0A846TV87_9MICC|nr:MULTISPECIES: helix-turn-helix domain-containing protein [Kocuria]NKE10789.1 helix-turn-helix transcriptional regulator [Kocuria subflava]